MVSVELQLDLQVLGLLTGFLSIRASDDQVSWYVLTRCRMFPWSQVQQHHWRELCPQLVGSTWGHPNDHPGVQSEADTAHCFGFWALTTQFCLGTDVASATQDKQPHPPIQPPKIRVHGPLPVLLN